MYHPTRGGVRGGADQFNWEDVKVDKYRENYLGHSVKAPVGRWQKGKDLSWYSKDKSGNPIDGNLAAKAQLAAIKMAEEEAMLAALGHKHIKKVVRPLSKEELSEALQRTVTDREGERVAGVGKSVSGQSFNNTTKNGIIFHGPKAAQLANKTLADEKSQDESEKSYKSKIKKHKKKSKHKNKEKKRHRSESSDDSRSKRHSSLSSNVSSNRNGAKPKRRRHDSDSSD